MPTLYRWKYRDPVRGKTPKSAFTTRWSMTEEQARQTFGENLLERIDSTREERSIPTQEEIQANSTSHLAPGGPRRSGPV